MNFFIKFAFTKYLKYPVALHICGSNRARSPEHWPFLQSETTSESRCLSFHCLSVSLPFLSLVWFFPFNHKLIKASERGLACVGSHAGLLPGRNYAAVSSLLCVSSLFPDSFICVW